MLFELPIFILVLLLAATLFSAAFQGATGFGYGLMAVPSYLLILGSKNALQISFIVMLFISLAVIPSIYKNLNRPLLIRLIAGSVIGFFAGTYLYIASNVGFLKLLVGISLLVTVVVVAYGSYQSNKMSPGKGREIVAGLFSGTLATSIALPGPPVLVYMTSHGYTRDEIRTTNLALMLFSNAGAIAAQLIFVGISAQTFRISGALSLVAIIGALIGARLTRYLNEELFRKLILVVLAITGIYMTVKSLFF